MSKKVTVAISMGDVVVGTTNSVVLDKVGASARKLGVAKGKSGIPVVRGDKGKVWAIHEDVELLKVKKGNKGGFKIIR